MAFCCVCFTDAACQNGASTCHSECAQVADAAACDAVCIANACPPGGQCLRFTGPGCDASGNLCGSGEGYTCDPRPFGSFCCDHTNPASLCFVSPTPTATVTATASATVTDTDTPTATDTPTVTPTASATWTLMPTSTPTATYTATPSLLFAQSAPLLQAYGMWLAIVVLAVIAAWRAVRWG